MGCCGQSRIAPPGQLRPPGRPASVLLEYRGYGALTVHGRLTGIRYHFPGPGARLTVDARDAPFVEIILGVEVVAPVT
jgi:hypothetical protein